MFALSSTIMCFKVPEEIKQAETFRVEHPYWNEECDTNYIWFTKEDNIIYGVSASSKESEQNV